MSNREWWGLWQTEERTWVPYCHLNSNIIKRCVDTTKYVYRITIVGAQTAGLWLLTQPTCYKGELWMQLQSREPRRHELQWPSLTVKLATPPLPSEPCWFLRHITTSCLQSLRAICSALCLPLLLCLLLGCWSECWEETARS